MFASSRPGLRGRNGRGNTRRKGPNLPGPRARRSAKACDPDLALARSSPATEEGPSAAGGLYSEFRPNGIGIRSRYPLVIAFSAANRHSHPRIERPGACFAGKYS